MGNQLFDEMIGTPPPSTVDVDDIVRRERRGGTARRLGGAMVAVLTLAVVGAGVVISPEPGAPSAPRAEASQPLAETKFRLIYETRETAEATAARLSQELDRALRKEAPEAGWIWEQDAIGETPKPDGQPPRIDYRERKGGNPTFFSGGSGVVNEGRKSSVRLSIAADMSSDELRLPRWSCKPTIDAEKSADVDVKCEERKTPSGEKMMITTYAGKKEPSVRHEVRIGLSGNGELIFDVENSFGIDGAPPAQPEPALTREQAQAIAIYIASRIEA